MRFVKWMVLLAALAGGFGASGGASATPLGSGTLLTQPVQAADALVEKAQYYRSRRGYYRPRVVYRPVYRRPVYYYRPPVYYRPVYRRSRIVCRLQYGYYGPRRVCVRRYY